MVTVSALPARNVAVTLISSDTNVVVVPTSAVIASNQLSTNFNVTIVDDTQIDGTQTATITAHVENWTYIVGAKFCPFISNIVSDFRVFIWSWFNYLDYCGVALCADFEGDINREAVECK